MIFSPISFNHILSLFSKTKLIISYLNFTEINKILNFPCKEIDNYYYDRESFQKLKKTNGICLLILSPTKNPLSPKEINNHLQQINNLKFEEVDFLNKKLSVVTAGLGQYGRNQLVYNNNFGFAYGIFTYFVYNSIIDLPKKPSPNYSLLNLCKNCYECIKNCPAHALHGNDYPMWLDESACQHFYWYGDHPKIPSIKYGVNKLLKNKYTKEQLKTVKDSQTCKELFGFSFSERDIILNGKEYHLDLTVCAECKNQLPCRRDPIIYDKDFLKIVSVTPY